MQRGFVVLISLSFSSLPVAGGRLWWPLPRWLLRSSALLVHRTAKMSRSRPAQPFQIASGCTSRSICRANRTADSIGLSHHDGCPQRTFMR